MNIEQGPSFGPNTPEQESKEEVSPEENIMSASEYQDVEHKVPYVYKLEDESGEIGYFGSPHVNNPEDEVFSEIEQTFGQTRPDIVLVENMPPGDTEDIRQNARTYSREEVIRGLGESGFVIQLAAQNNIEFDSPEPSDEELFAHLEEQFKREEIFAWCVLRALAEYHQETFSNPDQDDSFERYIEPMIEEFTEATDWEDFDYSYEHAIRVGEQLLGQSITPEQETDAESMVDPTPWEDQEQTVLNRIGEEASLFRDKQIVKRIADLKEQNTYQSIFVMYGASHAVMQEQALRELFNE